MKISPEPLRRVVRAVFIAVGCAETEADRIAFYLVEANLVGHDSHGVIRVREYVAWMRAGRVLANQQPRIMFETDCLAVVDGQFGFGQVVGEKAVDVGAAKAEKNGVAVVALRNSGHLGRIGDWAERAVARNLISLHFVNTNGAGMLVAPTGGIDRRLSANPIAAGVPVPGRDPIILDVSTASIAEGKIKVAKNKGVKIPDGCIIDSKGNPTNDPEVFYGDPPGVILPLGGHKGYGLSVLVEVLAGALTGGGCSLPNAERFGQGMLTVLLKPDAFVKREYMSDQLSRFIRHLLDSPKADPNGEILLPGDVERRTRNQRTKDGIDLDEATWSQIVGVCESVGIDRGRVDALLTKDG